jgi:hypothetical protein
MLTYGGGKQKEVPTQLPDIANIGDDDIANTVPQTWREGREFYRDRQVRRLLALLVQQYTYRRLRSCGSRRFARAASFIATARCKGNFCLLFTAQTHKCWRAAEELRFNRDRQFLVGARCALVVSAVYLRS